MSFVTPLFFLGALAASVPVLLHLVKRERARKLEFPTLMFLRRISKKTIRYQKLRHLLLLLLRALAFVLLALAFARPFRPAPQAAAASGRVTQAHIILLDNSLSMGYGDRWSRARQAASEIVRAAQRGDKAALLEFSDTTVARTDLTADLVSVQQQINNGVELTDRPTRYGQALRTAEKYALDAGTGRKIVHLISDFQRTGNAADEQEFRFGSGIELERVDLGSDDFSNLTLGDVRVIQGEDALQGAVTIKFGVVNFGTQDRKNVRVTLSVDGRPVVEKRLDSPRGSVQGAEFQLPGVAPGQHPAVLEVEDTELTRDNRFALTLEARGKTAVLSVENPGTGRAGRSPGFFLANALNVSQLSAYRLSAVAPAQFEKSGAGAGALVIWNGAWTGAAGAARKLQEMVRTGGGAVLVLPDASAAAEFNRSVGSWIPMRAEATGAAEGGRVRRPAEDYALLTDMRMDHPIFSPFREPHSGSFSTARFFKHARLVVRPPAEVIARFDNGDPALATVPYENGRVLVFTSSSDDSGNDLPLKSVFAPFWQQMLKYLENFKAPRSWVMVGDTIAPRDVLVESAQRQSRVALDANQAIAIVDPAKQRIPGAALGDSILAERTGFYEVKSANFGTLVAVNPVPRESDLGHANSEELAAGWSAAAGRAAESAATEERLTPEQQDRKQRLWRFPLAAALLLLLTEGLLSNFYAVKGDASSQGRRDVPAAESGRGAVRNAAGK